MACRRATKTVILFGLNILTAPGLAIVGPFPAELQPEVVFTAGHLANAEAAKAS
jgi:molybdate transport system substrate-binding protein